MSVSDQASSDPMRVATDRFIADAARAADGARARLGGVLNDLFRSPESRLSDRDHAVMTRMLAGLIDEIERIMLPQQAMPIAWAKLAHSRVMRDNELAAMLLRRSDEHQLAHALRAFFPQSRPGVAGEMDGLAHHDDGAIAELASALLIAESRRLDRFGDPLLPMAELPADLLFRMAWWIAAALRDELDDPERDSLLAQAVEVVVAAHEAQESAGKLAQALVARLAPDREAGGRLAAGLIREGWLTAGVAVLSALSGTALPHLWSMMGDRDASRLTLVLRATDMERAVALGLVADLLVARGVAGVEGDKRLAAAVGAFDALSARQARALIRSWKASA